MKEGHILLRADLMQHWPTLVATTCHSGFLMPLALLADYAWEMPASPDLTNKGPVTAHRQSAASGKRQPLLLRAMAGSASYAMLPLRSMTQNRAPPPVGLLHAVAV